MTMKKLSRGMTALALTAGALVGVGTAGATPAAAAAGVAEPTMRLVSGNGDAKISWAKRYSASTTCDPGRLCLWVHDPTKGDDKYWKVYSLGNCALYNLWNWEGGGAWANNQTGGVNGIFYSGSNGTGDRGYTSPAPPSHGTYGWSPINSVRNC